MIKKIFITISIIFIFTQCNSFAMFNGEKNMTREDITKENYEKLFNAKWNPNTGSDPEMMEILQKYIFGEVFTKGNLDFKTREMLTVVSLTTQQTLPQLKAHINAALNIGATPVELREAIYQCAPFIGFPKTLNAIGILNEVFSERGIRTPLESSKTISENERYKKGYEIQNPIYGDEIKKSLENLPDNLGDDAARFLTEVCFGDFYTRKGLDVKTRELLIIGILVTTGDTGVLKSHIRGNLKAGNSKETIAATIIQCMPYTGFPNALAALKTLKEVSNK